MEEIWGKKWALTAMCTCMTPPRLPGDPLLCPDDAVCRHHRVRRVAPIIIKICDGREKTFHMRARKERLTGDRRSAQSP